MSDPLEAVPSRDSMTGFTVGCTRGRPEPSAALVCDRDWKSLPVYGQTVNVLGLVGWTLSALMLQCENNHRRFISKWTWLRPDKTLFTETMAGRQW